jgi:hypothetical protein
MTIQNLSQLKKYLATPEAEITLIYSKFGGFDGKPHKYLNIPRKVEKLQTNAVKLEGGSWFDFNKADMFTFHDNNTFDILQNEQIIKDGQRVNIEEKIIILTYRYL